MKNKTWLVISTLGLGANISSIERCIIQHDKVEFIWIYAVLTVINLIGVCNFYRNVSSD